MVSLILYWAVWLYLFIIVIDHKTDNKDFNRNDVNQGTVISQTKFPFCIGNISLPQENTGYIYVDVHTVK